LLFGLFFFFFFYILEDVAYSRCVPLTLMPQTHTVHMLRIHHDESSSLSSTTTVERINRESLPKFLQMGVVARLSHHHHHHQHHHPFSILPSQKKKPAARLYTRQSTCEITICNFSLSLAV
jgi:hypothetical protein